jgi:D-glutamate cyclase
VNPEPHPADGHLAAFGDYVDRLVTVEMRNPAMPWGKIIPLYDAARAEGGGTSLCMAAANGLTRNIKHGDRVLIVTGSGTLPQLQS